MKRTISLEDAKLLKAVREDGTPLVAPGKQQESVQQPIVVQPSITLNPEIKSPVSEQPQSVVHVGQSNITVQPPDLTPVAEAINKAMVAVLLGSVSRAVSFLPKRYWGVSPDATLSNSDILALSQEFSSSKGKSITYDCSGGNYFYWCYPASLGLPSGVTVGGLAFSDYTVTVQSLTNASGYTQDYNVVRCNSLQTGAAINVVWS